jgi:NAD(P) transhydrogenase
VHVFGTGATEIVHLGQALMAGDMSVDYLVENVFNYPTLTEAYKVAALDATNKLRVISRLGGDATTQAAVAVTQTGDPAE